MKKINALEKSSSLLFHGWFNKNLVKAISDKVFLIMTFIEGTAAMINGLPIESNEIEVLLVIAIDQELKFDKLVNYLIKKGVKEINALAGITPFMDANKDRTIVKAFIESQYGNCPLTSMFCSSALCHHVGVV